MDTFLEKKCPNLIYRIFSSGHSFKDIMENPSYIFDSIYSLEDIENFAKQNNKEIDAAIKFVEDDGIDVIKEFNLFSIWKKMNFAIKYLAAELTK